VFTAGQIIKTYSHASDWVPKLASSFHDSDGFWEQTKRPICLLHPRSASVQHISCQSPYCLPCRNSHARRSRRLALKIRLKTVSDRNPIMFGDLFGGVPPDEVINQDPPVKDRNLPKRPTKLPGSNHPGQSPRSIKSASDQGFRQCPLKQITKIPSDACARDDVARLTAIR